MLFDSADRALLLREIRSAVVNCILPDPHSEQARDYLGHIERLLAMLILDEEASAEFEEFRPALVGLLHPQAATVSPPPSNSLEDWRQAAEWTVRNDPAAASSLGPELARTESAFQHRIASLREEIRRSTAGATQASGGDANMSFDADQLGAYLREHVPGAGAANVRSLVPVPGGRSKETVLAELDEAGDLPSSLVIRKDRPHSVTDATVRHEFELLKALHDTSEVPVPNPLWLEADPTCLGTPFMLVSRLSGSKQGEYHLDMSRPETGRRQIALQMAQILARIHAVPLEALVRTRLDARPDLRQRITAHVERIETQFADSDGPASIGAALATSWLKAHAEWGLLARPALVHGDFGLHNLLIEDGNVTGVLDWELATIASPTIDVAICRRMTQHLEFEWPDFVTAYVEAGGPPEACDPRSVAFYQVYGLVSGTVRSRYGGHLFRSGIKRDLVTANSGFEFHYRSSRLLADALVEALAIGEQDQCGKAA